MTLLPNGLIASGSSDTKIMIWNITKTYPLYTLTGHSNWIRALVVINNQLIASTGYDSTIKLWSLNTYANSQTWAASTTEIVPLVYDPTLNMLANGDNANKVRLWSSNIWTGASDALSKF
jgi:WD40 repeat protein